MYIGSACYASAACLFGLLVAQVALCMAAAGNYVTQVRRQLCLHCPLQSLRCGLRAIHLQQAAARLGGHFRLTLLLLPLLLLLLLTKGGHIKLTVLLLLLLPFSAHTIPLAVPALQAADKLLLTKEVISAVARQAGLQVTFLPKPLPGYAGSGCHCHISLWKVRNEYE
jgi:hypothetical protein